MEQDGNRSDGDHMEHGLSDSFRLTDLFLRRYPRYREILSLTPDYFRFDPVLWQSSVATLRGMLRALAEEEGLAVSESVLDRAVTNLVEDIVRAGLRWGE